MIPKRIVARLTAIPLICLLVGVFLAGARDDLGSWTAVAVVVIVIGGVFATIAGILWGLANWNAR